MKKTVLLTTQTLPKAGSFNGNPVVFYDRNLLKHRFFKIWLKQFQHSVALKAGESLKTLNSYQSVLSQLQKNSQKTPFSSETVFVAVGGGSVGDFVGFLASTFQRGKRLVHIPSTWLAAVDSAHGGKTGLNLNSVKNQIGTFYPAESVILVRDLLLSQPSERLRDSFGEILKIGVINRPNTFQQVVYDAQSVWKALPALIAGKMAIVQKDPFEKNGLRKVLNLGHTLGHVFEAHFGISHGEAVLHGMLFTARWSFERGTLKENDFIHISNRIFSVLNKPSNYLKIPDTKIRSLLAQDKKRQTSDKVDFIFIQKIGKVIIKSVTTDQVLAEVQRQRMEY